MCECKDCTRRCAAASSLFVSEAPAARDSLYIHEKASQLPLVARAIFGMWPANSNFANVPVKYRALLVRKSTMSNFKLAATCALAATLSLQAFAQEEHSIATEVELGAIITSGNTEDQNIKYKVVFDWDRGIWEYRLSSEGFRSKKDRLLAAQRVYHVARAQYTINEDSFILTRLAYEDDRFSGFDSQSDFSVSYGRNLLLDVTSMELSVNVGAGIRRSVTQLETSNEAILRFESNYAWNLSETAEFTQDFSLESGSESSVYRSESAIQTNIMENLSMKFSVKVKHQTEVPLLREKTDTETAVTLVWRF